MKSSLMAKTYHFFPQTLHKGSRNKTKIVSDQSLPHSKKLAASSQMASIFGKVKFSIFRLRKHISHTGHGSLKYLWNLQTSVYKTESQ